MYSTITDNNAALASGLCINSLFTVVAAQHGNNLAINFENVDRLTYRQVSKYVDLLADELKYHVSHGQLVAVLLPRSPAQVIAILAILKLGAIYVPINPELPKARIGSLISSVPIDTAICLAETEHQLPHKVLPLTLSGKYGHESKLKFPSSHRDTKNQLRITTDDLATILFTSGSTGQPKAVKLTHKNLIPQAKFLARELGLDSSRSVFQFSSCSFDVHLLDILSALLSGAQLHQASQSAILSDLEGQIMSFNSDTIQLTPSVISTLQPHNVPSIRCMVTCGEACTEEIVNTWGNRIVLLNIYGPCEAPTTSMKRLRPGNSPSCVGKPPSYANIAVVNERGQSLPPGHVGEVLAYGETVSQGYFNGEVQEKFTRTVQSTTGAARSSGWYATGDFGLIDETGELHLRGRADDQIKISGQRIELGDIHQVIHGIPGCGRCVVLAHTVNQRAGLYAVVSTDPGFGQPGNTIVIADGNGTLRKEIFASCRANLPAYMVPQVIIVKSLPRNVNGKVDVSQIRTFLSSRHTLDEMRLDKSEQLSEYGHQVASIIRKRLQQLVASKDDLLEWGFNSMDAVWVIKELHEKTGHRVSITELLSHPTIESIANQIESVSVVRTSHASEPTPMPRDWYVASPGQHSLFRATKVFGNKVYTCKIAYEIAGSLDPSRFLDCLTEKYAHHAIFNTSFVEDETGFKEGNLIARVKPDTYNRPRVSFFPFEQSRRAHSSATSTGVSLLEAVYDWEMSQETDLDIEEGPVASAALYQTDKDPNEWLVILTFHHMVIDEYSSNTFWSELIDLYQAKTPTAMITPTKRIDYSQYATIYRAMLESRGTSDGDWWRDVFRGYRPQPLFQDAIGNHSERLSGYDVAADIYWKILPQREATRLTARRGNAANTFGAWLSLAQLFLSRVTGKTEYLLGVPTSTRSVDPRFVSVMGYCMTLAVLPVSLDSDQDSLVFEAATLEKYRQCVAHDQRVEDILSWLAEENQTENTANVDALFVYHDPLDSSLDLGNSGLHYKKLADATGGSHYHLILHLDNSGPSIRVGFEYRTESFSTNFIEALAQAFTELVVELSCCDEQRSVGEIVSTAPSQALQFAVEASTRQAGPVLQELRRRGENLNILNHIYMTASVNQSAIAIATAERNVTYRQLLEWVSGVASKLRREGVKTGDVVVLFMDKSVEYLVSVLALIRVGACFVPLDITNTPAVNNSKLAVLTPTLILTRQYVNGAVYEDENYYRKLDASSIRRIAISTPPQADQPHHNVHEAKTSTTELSADAYIAFTSGSTAEPKCFRISHRALVSSICGQVEALNISTGHRVAMLTSLAFDVSLMEIFCTFVAGSTLVVAPHDQFITSLADTLRNMAVTHAIATPTMLAAIDSPSEVPSLESIILGGEPIPSVLYERWWGTVDIRISYGPAETTIATHDFIVTTKPTTNSCNIGRPSPSVRAFVLDAQHNPVLPGIPGRLFIGAAEDGKYDQLTSGYISPLSANKRLVDHPKLGRLYDTGDIVRYDLQGTFTLIGRTDDQVKISGVRFNIGDVEKTIDVFVGARRRCAVVISETQPGNKALTCFIEFSDTDDSITMPSERHVAITSIILLLNNARCEELAALRDRVSEALPAAMIPKYWIPVKELPVSRTGKIDRRRLNEELASAHHHGTNIEAYSSLVAQISHLHEARVDEEVIKSSQSLQYPASGSVPSYRETLNDELMQSLVIAWTEILPIDETQVDIHRSFFKTGGDSVSAIRFCARARKLGIRGCTVAKMRSNPSLSQLHDVLAYDNSSLLSNMPSSDDEPTDEASGLTPPSSMPSTPTSSGSSFVKLPGATDFTALSISGHSVSTTDVDDEEFTGIFRHVESFMNTSELSQEIAAAGINESEVDVVYPPTAMQSSMVQQSLLDSNSGVYHSQLILHLEGSVQEMKLRKAWSAVCNANPSLRTIFVLLERGHVPGVAYLAVELKQNVRTPLFESHRLPLPSPEMFEDLLDHDRKVGIGATTNVHKMTLVERGPCEYTLIFTCHHAVFDGWSTTTLLKQLGEAYSGTLPLKTSRSNAEYFTQQLTRDKGASEDLWRQYLAGVQLPQLPQREHVMEKPSHKRIEAALQTAILSSEFQARAEAFGVTPFTIVQLAFALALEGSWIDHGSSTRVGFWTVTSGRSQMVDDINAIGNFLNTIPCVVALSSTTSVHKSLQATYRMFTKMSEHDCVSTTDILRCFEKPECDIDALLVFENHPDASEPQLHFGSNIRLNSVDGREVSSLPFVVVVEPGQTEVKIIAKFDEARHHSGSVRRVLDRFSTILSNIVSHSTLDECSLSSISCDYLHSEKQLVLQQAVNLSQQSGPQETLVSLFRQCVAKHGQRKALATHSSWLTFAELDNLTDRLAIYLSRQDNSNSKIVPIVLEKSPWMVIAMLAVLKSGRAYCPLEFDAPSHRISFAIKRLGAGLIITNENGFPKLASLSAWGHPQILVIDNIQTLLANAETRTSRDAVSLLPTLHPDMACYVMFTSGSTSSPKACTLTHGAVASAVQAVQPQYNFEPSSRILLFANYVFDASAIDIWGSLSSGSCLFLLHDDELKSDLIGHIDRLRINWIHLTPTVLRTISPDQVPSLKTIILGGEMMVPDLLNIWAKQVEIVAAYGPTEAAIQVLTFRPSRYPIDEITYTALPGNLVVVVNERREICHINEPGEIVIAGKQLFVGYEGNSLATQASLTTIHGFGDFKFYKTGDRAYYSHIGEDEKPHIRILGRVDHQMKVSGMRIAPEEIEEVLSADPDVVCSAVVASYGRSIDALVVGRDNNLNVKRLMTLCRERLPERLRPVIHQVKEIPLLASRKVDRKRLSTLLDNVIASKPGGRSSSLVSQHESAKISAVTAIIENVLGTKVLDVNAPLANLGLDSLGFMRLKHSLCTKFHLPDLTYRQLRNIATAAGIADLVGMDQSSAVSSDHDVVSVATDVENVSPTRALDEKPTKTPIRRTGRYLALPSQLAMWVAQERLQDTTYNVQRVWRFEDVTADALLSGLLDVVHRLEMFRTTFEFDLSVGKLHQVVHDETLVAVQISQISHIDMDDLRARFIPHNCATIDLRNGPLAIFHLIADGRTVVLHSTIHHIIVDEFTSIQLFNLIRCASRGSSDPCAFEGTSSIALHAAQTADRHDENHLNEWKQRMSGAIGIDTESHYEGSYDQLSRLGSEDSLEDFTRQIREGVDFALESDMAINKVASACGLDTANFMIQFIMHDAQSYDDMSSDMTDMTLDLITSEKPMFDLMWHVFAHKDCLDVLVEFNEQKYAKDDVKVLVQAWEKVIDKSNCQGGQSISSILSTIIPEVSLFKKTDSNTKLAKQACELQVPPPSDLTSNHEHRATSTPINISGGLNQRAIELQSLVTDSLCRALGVTVVDLDQNLREIGLDSFAAMSFIASILRVEPELEISLRDITACPSVRLLVDTLVQKDGPQSKYDEARARFESLIRESLCKSLGIASIDDQSSLRELGLDSFSCMAFMADMIRHEPDISVSMRDVMGCPTMESLVEHFADRALSETCDNKSDDGSYVALGKDMLQRPQHGLASSMQKRFYLLQEQLGDSTYSLPSAYRVHGVHLSRVIAALQDIVTEHDIFRTHFDFTDESELVQIVDESERLEFTIHDLSNHSDVTAAEEVTRISHEECMREFNLAEGHLVRCTAIILPNGEQYIIINFHHCVADERTITGVWEELCSAVTDKSCSKETANVDAGSYIDFSTRHHEMLKSNKLAEAQTFFQNLLVGPENSHGLFLRPGPETESYPDAITINRGTIFDYDPVQWAYKSGSTPFAAYLFTFQLLLSFKSGTEGSSVLIPATCRGPREQNLYGCFINTLPVRFTKLAGTCSMTETLREFQDCLAKILEYSDIPFERLLESIGWGANNFDTIFTYHNVPAGAREKARTIEPCKGILPEVLPGISAKFPLAFTITREMTKDGKSKLDMSVEFNPDRISEVEVLEICKEYECLLRHIQKLGPHASLNDIEVATNGTTSESESHKDTSVTQRDSLSEVQPVSKVPSWFHGMPNPIVETTPFADVQILDQAKARPSATAMIFENEISITYKEMVDMISGLASYLSTRIGPQNMLNQAICIVGDASIERIITILAIMTAGGAYVPIELNNPIDWNLTIIADCEPAAVVFIPEKEPLRVEQSSQLRAQLKAKGILCVDINTPLPMTSEPFKLTTKRLPEHLAYVLYTSGSTGKPKGVAIQNHALRNATVSLRPLYRLAPNKRLLQLAPWTFDVSVIDIFGTLTVGATLCIGRKSWMLDDLQDTMAMLRITHIATTPTIAGALDANALPDVECLDIGGEPMTELCRDVWASKATLFNIYGPTEATVDVLGRQCFPDTDISNIGRPLENVFVYVLDDKLKQVGIGEVGQLAIGGYQLARGYLKPPAGAAAFVDTKDYGRIYLTGDCARFEPDGSIVCLGRMDTMVNLRGLRVELGAIESAVNNVLDQGKSVVIMIKRPSGDCLVAIFTDASLQTKDSLKPLSLAGLRPLIQKLQVSVKDKLPAYFMPSLWVPVNDIPMNNNGKLDRKMIKSLIGELSEEALDGYLPQSATDEKLGKIDDLSRELPSSLPFQQSRVNESGLLRDNTIGVQTQDIVMQAPGKSEQDTCDQTGMAVRAAFHTVLGTKSLENNSNFFSMGGDSISVIKLRSAFTKAGLKCKVKDIYQNPTIGALTLFFGGTISHESPNGIVATGRSASSSTVAQVPTERPLITIPAPTTETRIQSAFKEILGDQQFPMDASFFSMGGDSISVIRLRSVLTKAGFKLKVKDIYQNPTITALADFLDPSRSTRNSTDNGSMLQSSVQSLPKTESQMVSNLVPPTPIIDWFFASQRANENWFNQGHIIKLNKKHTYEDFQRAWSNIVEAHPMLRLVVSKSATHEHGKFIGIPNESTNHTYFLGKRLSSMEELPEELSKLQSCLNLSSGRICAVGGFHIGDELYCAIFAHHLAVDVVSWQVIWSDLEDLLQGDSIEPEFSSFPEWAEYLSNKRQIAAQIPARIHAREYSSFLTTEQMKRLSENTEASGSFMNVKVDVSTLDLRREDTEPVDMMLAGLVLALSTWQRLRRPTNQVELHFESHGRDLELEELDLTRTVGWFTRIIPIAFNVPLQGSVNDFTTMVQQTRKHAMSNVNLASAIETAPVDGMVTFNYLGQRARTSPYTSFENVEMDLGMYQSPTNQRFSILDIECSLTHEGQLDIGVFYSTAIHTANEIRQLLDSWSYCIRSVADESQADIAGMRRIAVGRGTSGPPTESLGTPIDHSTYSIPECMQGQKDAIEESIVAWKLNIQDIEKMAPATDGQAAMLLASLGSRSYMHSYNYEASDTNTDIQRLQHAWDVVLGRHSIFRTIFMPLSPQATYNEKSHHSDIQLVQVILKATALPTPLVQTGKKLKPMQPGFAKQLCRLHIHKSPTTQKVICTWTCHHALIDGFSMRLVLDEVRSVYNGRALAPQITQFSDIVVSRYEKARQDLTSNDFWQSQMRDIEPSILVNPLRADQGPPEMQKAIHETLIDRHQQFCFPVSSKHFKDAAHYNHTTIPILFHAAWALTLSTYLSTRDVVLGSVVSGRRGEDIERIQNVVGPCLNTVPLRVCVDWNQNMCQFIEHVTDIFLDMAEHEDLLSLKQIQGLSGKKTLFNSTLITNTPLKSENIAQSGLHLTLKDMDEVTDVPVLLNMSCEDSTIVVDARVHGEDIDEEQLCRMMGTLGIVLQHVADARHDTTRPLHSMDLLETNHHRVIDDLVSGPRFPIEYDGLTCSQLLQSRVSRSPDQSAVELYRKKGQKPVVMTYKALSTIVELGAKRLRAGANLEPKSRVAIFLDKSTELICAIHAIHRADCAYVALDIDNPQARTKLLLEQISPSAIICSKGTLKLLPQTFLGNDKCPFIVAEQLFSPATQSSNDSYYLPPSTATSDDVAAILFTSGTTGTPKAVIMPHRQVVGYGIMMAEAIGYSSDDRVFNFARLVFDVSQSDIFGAIYSGATLVLAPQTETVSRLPALLRESGTTSLNTTPSIASLLYPDNLPHIRSLCLAGEMATKAVYERWTPFVRVINAYGPTEAVVISWKHATASSDPRCIGRPSIGIQIHILDDHMRRVPIGSIGTIWCSGRQLSDGYYGRPEETTKAFRENPYGPGLIYNTGDLGAYDSNGEIVYHARKDRQIKVNGRRLELSEIERTLTTRNHSVVVLLLDSNLVAFCCKLESLNDGLNDNMAQALASMEAQAHQMLPSFMIPKCFVPVSAIPLTGNSKVDQLKLHEIYKQWKTQRSVPVHDATALTLRPTVQAPEKSTYEQQVPSQQHGRPQDIDWSLREDDWSDYLLPYFNPKAPLGTQPRRQIFAFFAITGTSKQHSILAPYLPSFNLIGVENIFFHQPDYYSSLQAMAVEHSALIRRQQPTGPYLLAGFSFAGQLAYEVANELRQLGENDIRVVLIDSAARERAPTRPGGVTDAECEKFFKVPTTLEATAAGPEVVEYRQGLLNQIRHNITLHNEYVPRPFDGNALIIPRLPNQGEAWDDDETNGYAEFVPQARLQVRTVTAADHFAVMEEEQSLRKVGQFIEEFMAGF
ncbi:Linear gramicidin synthase subunit C [Trichoderma lentiforme]|uniref:Linear gramicidin synthase subunit C n=1 Tax=Trichoderma lentiforme TaxID=1567552 RepID=A0A9P4XBV9_9HYPO|nr:Linear gramicidin synthase subunit C [Trichoderma lentiforme]